MAESILYKYMKKYMPYIVLSVICSTGHNYLNLQLPLLLQKLVDDVIQKQDWSYLWELFGILVILFFGAGVFGLFQTLLAQHIGINVVYNIRNDMFRSLQAQSYRFYDQNRTGDIMSKTTHDVNIANNFLSQQFVALMRDIITLIVILVIVFRINTILSLLFLAIVPILYYMMIWYRKVMYPTYLKMANTNGTLTSVLQENVTGVRVVKAFARERLEMEKFHTSNQQFFEDNMKVAKISTMYGPLQEFITQIASVVLLFLGGVFVLNRVMSLGEVVAFYVYFSFIYGPIRGVVNFYSLYSQVQASMVRINSILENKIDITEKENPIIPGKLKGEYEFHDVWFSYDNSNHYSLKELTFNVRSGERLAILGATGSGKSTLINLIPRFYDVSKGYIKVDGIDIRDLKIDDYRTQIGIVSQDIFLFSRSIKDNIAYGSREKVSQEDIEKVAKIAAIHNFIVGLPDGYKTIVGERGQTLSGGQKQRVAIARALLLNPRVLILDDSLSAVDIDTEAQIQKALDALFQDRTTFIITQRISTVQNCDRIMVLDDGKILEIGTHDELYAANGIYTKIYNTMFKAQTKSKDRMEKRKLETPPIETKFTSLPAADAKTLEKYYKETFEDEEKRIKAEAKAAQRIEKDQIRDQLKEQKLEKRLEKQALKEEKMLEKQTLKEEKLLEKQTIKEVKRVERPPKKKSDKNNDEERD